MKKFLLKFFVALRNFRLPSKMAAKLTTLRRSNYFRAILRGSANFGKAVMIGGLGSYIGARLSTRDNTPLYQTMEDSNSATNQTADDLSDVYSEANMKTFVSNVARELSEQASKLSVCDLDSITSPSHDWIAQYSKLLYTMTALGQLVAHEDSDCANLTRIPYELAVAGVDPVCFKQPQMYKNQLRACNISPVKVESVVTEVFVSALNAGMDVD